MEPTTNTPNKRLARVLETLARVAAKGDKGCLAVNDAMHFALKDDMERAEACAAEAARLAGVPLDGWNTSEPPKDAEVLVTTMDGHVCSAIFVGDSYLIGGSTWGTRSILAWRPLPEPYQAPEEVPHA